jgi:erythromycin esterase-like protein
MRQYNAQRDRKLHFYGFDAPTEMTGADSPRQLLTFTLDYLASIDPNVARPRRTRIEELLGNDADWSNPAATFDPTQSIGLSPNATALRIETEDLIAELHLRRPELIERGGRERYLEAEHHAAHARQMLNYHAALARQSPDRVSECLGLRDVMMAENLAHILAREQGRADRGRVLAFAHNSHLQRGPAQWQLGPQRLTWWPAGAHLHAMLGPRYAVIGAALGWSDANGIPAPDVGSFEHRLTSTPGPARLIPTHRGQGLPLVNAPAARTTPWKNPSYFPLTARSFTDFDWLAALDSTPHTRGGPKIQ